MNEIFGKKESFLYYKVKYYVTRTFKELIGPNTSARNQYQEYFLELKAAGA
jgi:hypothetical protein